MFRDQLYTNDANDVGLFGGREACGAKRRLAVAFRHCTNRTPIKTITLQYVGMHARTLQPASKSKKVTDLGVVSQNKQETDFGGER